MSTDTPTPEGVADATVSEGDALVEIDDLKTYYGEAGLLGGQPVKAVDGVSFDIVKGETLGLVGESGCGKSTLGRTLIGLESATGGAVRYKGTDITELSKTQLNEMRQDVQMVFQDPDSSLNERMTVGEIIKEPLDVHEWKTPRDRRARVRDLLDIVGLQPEHYYRYPFQFSGGQKQRIGIARALALNPDFIILDEPVSALDASVQAKILNLLNDLQDEFGLTYLFIAHDLAVVEHVCDRVAVMYLGNIMELGDSGELFDDPANPYTLSLLSAIPEPDPSIRKDRITLRGTPPSPRDPPTGCPFSTRCPMKIRPAAYHDLDRDVWEAIEVFREVLRERSKVEYSPTEQVRQLLGMSDPYADIEDVLDEEFGDVDIPPAVQRHIDEAVDRIRAGDAESARNYLRDEFASVCEGERPALHPVGDTDRVSLCHRHTPEYEEPAEYFDHDALSE
jgi:peptide/nickel transport system ATP-binding protein